MNPEPEADTTAGELFALLTKETDALAFPGVGGANLTDAVVLAPTATVFGSVSPVTVKALLPVTFAAEIVTEAFPVLLSVTVWLALLPTATWPKFRLAGEALNIGAGAGVAFPLKPTGDTRLVALLSIVILPD